MGFKIIFSPQALWRLEEIVKYISTDNPEAAERFGLYLVNRTTILEKFPELGLPYQKRRHVRRLSAKPYLIYYQVNFEEQTVEIIDYWHSAQRNPKF